VKFIEVHRRAVIERLARKNLRRLAGTMVTIPTSVSLLNSCCTARALWPPWPEVSPETISRGKRKRFPPLTAGKDTTEFASTERK